MNKKRTLNIRSRLIMGFLILFACITMYGIFSSKTATDLLTHEIRENTLHFATRYMSDLKKEIERKAAKLVLISSVTRIWEKENPSEVINRELLKKLYYIYGYQVFNRIMYIDRSGICTADTNQSADVGKNFTGERWWQFSIENGVRQGAVVQDPESGELYVPVTVRIDDEYNEFAGELRAFINISVLAHIVELKDSTYNTTKIRLFNKDGQIIYSTGAFKPLESFAESPILLKATGEKGSFLATEYGIKKIFAYVTQNNDYGEEPWKMLIGQNTSEALAQVYELRRQTYIIFIVLLALTFGITFILSTSITKPLGKLFKAVKASGPENLSVRTNINTGDEIGLISQAYDSMMDIMEERTAELESRNWLQTGQNRIAEKIRGENSLTSLCGNILKEVCEYGDADIGSIFLMDQNILKRFSVYNYFKDREVKDEFFLNEGFVGQTAADKKTKIIDNLPENYVYYGSDIGRSLPSMLVLLPLLFGDEVKGVIELGFIKKTSPLLVYYLEEISESIAIAVSTLQSMENERTLLKRTEQQKQELQAQQEELRVSNEELEEQTGQLRISESKLMEQRAELEQSNAELEEKNEILNEKQEEISLAQKKLELKADELEQASKYKSEFLSNMSHELRTPLNSLLLLAGELANNEEGNLTDDQVESAQIIYNGGNDLLTLINQILDLSRIEAGRLELYIDDLYINNIVRNIKTAFTKMASGKNIDYIVEVESTAPESLKTDSMRVEQILRNLIGNAVKFTSKGEVRVVFSGSDRIAPGGIVVTVSDTGIGIPENKQSAIFEAFQQADGSTSRRFGGTGLGLSIVKELTALLNGEIKLESAPGKGSKFTLCLPPYSDNKGDEAEIRTDIKTEPENQEPLPEENGIEINDDSNNIHDNDKLILAIEDDIDFLNIVIKHCRKEGYKCIGAATGLKGITLASKYKPDGIILDMKLPGMNGHTVLQRLKDNEQTRLIPVHIISAEAPTIDVFQEGAIGFISKPVRQEQLHEVIEKLTALSRTRTRKLLVIEDDRTTREHITRLLSDDMIEISQAENGTAALNKIREENFHCIILDLGLPDINGFELLEKLKSSGEQKKLPPVIIYTGRDLSEEEEIRLNEISSSIIVKDVRSDNRLIDEVSLFIHKVIESGNEKPKQVKTDIKNTGLTFDGEKILIVDDDMRALFALSKILSSKGLDTVKAESGEKALKILDEDNDIDLILMDIMMPGMDGFETIKRIREEETLKNISIIALTAKAMKGDREKCLEAGANDYLTKPVDAGKLLSLLQVWLYRKKE